VLVAEATRAAAASDEGEEGEGLLQVHTGAALVADATCAAPAGGEDKKEDGSSLTPCQAVAGDPEGSLKPATAKGGGRDKVSATMFAFPAMCLTSDVSSAKKASCRCPWVRYSMQG
jgi:hypothetical protein